MSRPRLVVHGHFYQPSRVDPPTGTVPPDPSAAPGRDWNSRIAADCYRPNAEAGNLGRISWDVGPTLAGWLVEGEPVAYRGFVEGDRGVNGLAQPFHHTILPLASMAERRTEIRWGLRDFEVRFGRRATGVWLPETAVDLATLRALAAEGVTHTILAPWQLAGDLDTRRPYRVDLGDGRSIVVVLYDAGLSTSISFEPEATSDAERFARERIVPRLTTDLDGHVVPPFALIATDGELYGHHQAYRELFLAHLVGDTDLGYEVVTLAEIARTDQPEISAATLVERTSWSCHHGVARWHEACACVQDGRWKAPLRAVLDRLADLVDQETETIARTLLGSPDPWPSRDAYVDVVIGAEAEDAFVDRWLPSSTRPEDRRTFADLMAAQRWRLAMFASCGWFWEVPNRPETAWVIRAATHAARLIDRHSEAGLEGRLAADVLAWTSASGPDAREAQADG